MVATMYIVEHACFSALVLVLAIRQLIIFSRLLTMPEQIAAVRPLQASFVLLSTFGVAGSVILMIDPRGIHGILNHTAITSVQFVVGSVCVIPAAFHLQVLLHFFKHGLRLCSVEEGVFLKYQKIFQSCAVVWLFCLEAALLSRAILSLYSSSNIIEFSCITAAVICKLFCLPCCYFIFTFLSIFFFFFNYQYYYKQWSWLLLRFCGFAIDLEEYFCSTCLHLPRVSVIFYCQHMVM
jgi:hypothetical protein